VGKFEGVGARRHRRHDAESEHGIIERDPATGEATGTLRESAQGLLRAVVPSPTRAEREAGLARALDVLNGFGVTSFVDAAVDGENLDVYRALLARGELSGKSWPPSKRESKDSMRSYSPAIAEHVAAACGCGEVFPRRVLEGETAALLEPYIGRDGTAGALNYPPDVLATRGASSTRATCRYTCTRSAMPPCAKGSTRSRAAQAANVRVTTATTFPTCS